MFNLFKTAIAAMAGLVLCAHGQTNNVHAQA